MIFRHLFLDEKCLLPDENDFSPSFIDEKCLSGGEKSFSPPFFERKWSAERPTN
jgi:hypothetical protein